MSYQRAKEIFLAACDLPAEERERFVRRECAGDEELRESVENLLAGDSDPRIGTGSDLRERLDSLLEAEPEEGDRWLGERLGRYKLTEKLVVC